MVHTILTLSTVKCMPVLGETSCYFWLRMVAKMKTKITLLETLIDRSNVT